MGFVKEVKADTARNHATRHARKAAAYSCTASMSFYKLRLQPAGFRRGRSHRGDRADRLAAPAHGLTTGTSRKMGQRCCCSGEQHAWRGTCRQDRPRSASRAVS